MSNHPHDQFQFWCPFLLPTQCLLYVLMAVQGFEEFVVLPEYHHNPDIVGHRRQVSNMNTTCAQS
jgi:hypothetical protein